MLVGLVANFAILLFFAGLGVGFAWIVEQFQDDCNFCDTKDNTKAA